jgi:hypothetical protein
MKASVMDKTEVQETDRLALDGNSYKDDPPAHEIQLDLQVKGSD